MDQSYKGLMKQLLPDDLLLQKFLQGLQWQIISNILQRAAIAADADISQQIQILHKVIPMPLRRIE